MKAITAKYKNFWCTLSTVKVSEAETIIKNINKRNRAQTKRFIGT